MNVLKSIGSGEKEMFYRGQAEPYGNTLSGIFRNSYFKREDNLFKEFLIRDPSLFDNNYTNFDRLAVMQHHGLPTRLLDLTRNPLVALFFAVSGNQSSGSNGEIFPFSNEINIRQLEKVLRSENLGVLRREFFKGQGTSAQIRENVNAVKIERSAFSDQVELEASMARLTYYDKQEILKAVTKFYRYLKDNDVLWYQQYKAIQKAGTGTVKNNEYNKFTNTYGIVKLYHEIKRDIHDFDKIIDPLAFYLPKIITPKIIDDRINNQRGLFLFVPFVLADSIDYGNLSKEAEKVAVETAERRIETLRVSKVGKLIKFVVRANKKASILAELAQIGVTEDFIYPDHEHIAKKIRERYT
ncbi:hypothetical protein C5Z25_11620 [Lactobacillus sp. CBA3605]|uniref:FRG domain-containing protein n=1 Tax=Lactobacillus sp. CBA3605 TaxID=2099788 RepID=UPI000CFD6BE5|nr:FRG domain-containing protein [Lactobacillus sp. CBA3605]AVK62365.1 hypothetical protein C5Z25_11620 [Lactobacillus sp. CBA3605]